MLIEFSYMYRDGDNYKNPGSLLLDAPDGTDLGEVELELRSYLDSAENFIANQVGIEEFAGWARHSHSLRRFCAII